MKKNYWKMLAYDIIGSLFLGCGIVSFAMQANFAPGGVSGLAVLGNYLFHLPVGWLTVLINIPIIVFTFRELGRDFFLISIKAVLISSLITDYVCRYIPPYTGSRLTAAIFAGILAGVGYSLFFNEGSSTGGTDFIVVALKKHHPKLSFGLLVFFIDSTVIVLSVFVFREVWAFVYGAVYTVVTSLALDGTTFLLKKLPSLRKKPEQQPEQQTPAG